MQTHTLNLNPFEAGMLRGILEKHKEMENLPETLRLKLDILFTKHYLDHPTMGKQARKDLIKYRIKLQHLEVQHGRNS